MRECIKFRNVSFTLEISFFIFYQVIVQFVQSISSLNSFAPCGGASYCYTVTSFLRIRNIHNKRKVISQNYF
jgi:hypothetical protein